VAAPPRGSATRESVSSTTMGWPRATPTIRRTMVQDLIAGIDIGGTKIAVAIASAGGDVIARTAFPTDRDGSPRDSMTRALDILTSLADQHQGELASVGIGCAGPLDFELGHVLCPPNMPRSWHNFPLRLFVEDKLKVPVKLDNDANAAALGENLYGAGRGFSDLVYLTISTGIGVGIIAGDKLVHRMGEGGHVTVQPGGALCGCGARGCMETLCSGTGIARRAQDRLRSGVVSKMTDMVSNGEQLTARIVVDAVRSGDSLAIEVWHQTIELMAIGIGSIVVLLSPQAVILGGGVAAGAGDFLIQPLRAALRDHVHIVNIREVALLQAGLGSESGIHGALVLAARALPTV
jgi:glucokinase